MNSEVTRESLKTSKEILERASDSKMKDAREAILALAHEDPVDMF